MESIEITNFGPIKDVKLTLTPLTVLIGQQASGKSTIAKLVHFFKTIPDEIWDKIWFIIYDVEEHQKQSLNLESLKDKLLNKFYLYFETIEDLSNYSIKYNYFKQSIFITNNTENQLIISFSKELEELLTNVIDSAYRRNGFWHNQLFDSIHEIEKVREIQVREAQKEFYLIFGMNDIEDVYFIPAQRSVFSTIKNNSDKFLELDYLTKEYLSELNLLKPMISNQITGKRKILKYSEEKEKEINLLVQKILKGRYEKTSTDERIYFSATDFVKIAFASSGQQEVIGILLLLYWLSLFQRNDIYLFIEEPEAHLYPNTQKDVITLVGAYLNQPNHSLMVTTHSPYVLEAFNNLIYAAIVGEKRHDDAHKIIPDLFWIQPENVSAFEIVDGQAISIIDDELRLIKTEAIDRVSLDINNTFAQLSELDETE